MYLLDTNHCSRILNGDPDLIPCMQSLRGELVATSVIVHSELVFMARRSDQRSSNYSNIFRFLRTVSILRIDDDVADRFAAIKFGVLDRWGPGERAKRRRATLGHTGFSENDLWIAATALRHGLRLVSSDGDFR